MQNVDLILTNALVVTMDENYRVLPRGAVAIRGDAIQAVGEAEWIAQEYAAAEVVDCQGKALIPGLINAHTHVPMTLLRGLADDLRLDVWLLGYIMPVERQFVNRDFSRLGARIACSELIRSGVTCFADMYYFEEAVAEAVAEVGMRAVLGQTVLKFPTPDAASYEDALALARGFIERWRNHPLIVPAVAPHSPYTCTTEILRACTNLALEFDVPLLIHISETELEVENSRKDHDMPVVPWVKKVGIFEAKVLAAHCVHVDDGEIRTLQNHKVGVAHNPSSNLKLASGFAPVPEMLAAGLSVGIGTDGTASNNDLDMFEEIRLASFLGKATAGDPTALPARQTLAMATRLGAQALHIADLTGSLEPGKRADLVLVDLDPLHNAPEFQRDPQGVYARLVYSAKSTDVVDVMVNGAWLMRERRLLTLNEAELRAPAAELAAKIDAFLEQRENSVLSKLVAIGGAEQGESYEVQIKVPIPDPEQVIARLQEHEIVRTAHYREYDTYFSFEDPAQGRLRYREDEFINAQGEVFNVRYRLTLTGVAAEHTYPNSVLLSRSRFFAPAIHSLRFYREYFNPSSEIEVCKDRLRWLIRFKGEEFFINIDTITQPVVAERFLEIKARTWSRSDAEKKAGMISELLELLGIGEVDPLALEYPDLAAG